MFANSFQSGFISIFYSVGSNPLSLWDKQVKNGHIRRVIDDEVKSLVLEISGTNVATTYITCPIKPRASLGIKLPFLVMIIKNMKKYFTFEIQILDDKDMHRRFRVSNFQSTTKVRPFCTTMPIGLSSGWNQVQFNLADFTKRAYGSTYLETMRVQVHANVRIRRLYFTDTLYSDEDMPNEFKLFGPVTQKKKQPDLKLAKDQAKEPPSLASKAEDKAVVDEFPPPPSPAEAPPEKEIEVIADEQVHPSEVGDGPPQEDVEPQAEEGAQEGESIDEKVVTPEGEIAEETSRKDEAVEDNMMVSSQEGAAAVAESTEQPIGDTPEEPTSVGESSAPPSEKPSPIQIPPTAEEQPGTEETAPTDVTEEPGSTENEPAITDVASSEPTAVDEPAAEVPIESENEG